MHPSIDVRSPLEFAHAHITNAKNICLLNDEERKIIGTIYKQDGNQAAVIKGYSLVGNKFSFFIQEALKIAPQKEINIYCWRGGLRSNIMAFVLHTAGFKVNLLRGGYKAFRAWTSEVLNIPKTIKIIGGKTGSGKTLVLEALQNKGQQVINLEALANHKGSAFGALGQLPQTSNEQFENNLAMQWHTVNPQQTLWLENESRTIGSNVIPLPVYNLMRVATTIDIRLPLDQRINYIMQQYACFSKTDLETCTKKIAKRLGNLRLNEALEHLQNNNLHLWAAMMLAYYDKSYNYGNSIRNLESLVPLSFETIDANVMASKIIEIDTTPL